MFSWNPIVVIPIILENATLLTNGSNNKKVSAIKHTSNDFIGDLLDQTVAREQELA